MLILAFSSDIFDSAMLSLALLLMYQTVLVRLTLLIV
jgi:hypothetical protein